MRISDILDQDIGILGFGIEGRSMLDALRRAGHRALVHVFTREATALPAGAQLHVTHDAQIAWPKLDVVIRSPGFAPHHPLRRQLDAFGLAQTTATRLFLREARALAVPLIGITGSKGKSTTATLTHRTLEAAAIPSVLVGNVGVSALDVLDRVRSERLAIIMELSSYQCADLEAEFGPPIAGVLDLFPEHLDWHGTVEAYFAAKLRAFDTQRPDDIARYNEQAGAAAHLLAGLPARARAMNTHADLHFDAGWFCRGRERLFSDDGMLLFGLHNRRNAVAALALSEPLGTRPEHLQQAVQSFAGLPFRLQREASALGIEWVNDAISTAPEAVAAALSALAGPLTVRTLIVGGQQRGLNQSVLIRALAASSVRTLIALPDTGSDVARDARAAGLSCTLLEAETLESAVQLAAAHTVAGEVCLYSPGAPSYNRYKSFEERGREFRRLVSDLGAAPEPRGR